MKTLDFNCDITNSWQQVTATTNLTSHFIPINLKMSYIILIRESTPEDTLQINFLVKAAYLSNVNTAWCNALFKEVRFYNK